MRNKNMRGLRLNNGEPMRGVSIIICCYNCKKRIARTLRHLSELNLIENCPFELIFVDNNSCDNISVYVKDLWDSFGSPFFMKVVAEKKPGLAYARRSGVLAAKYEYGIFCDDDNWLENDYLEKLVNNFDRYATCGIVGGSSTPVSTVQFPAWFFSKAENFAVGLQADESGDITWRRYVWGAGMGFRAQSLKSIYRAGVEPNLTGRQGKSLSSGDDSEISAWMIIAGYRIHYDETMQFRHFIDPNRLSDDYRTRFFIENNSNKDQFYSFYLIFRYRLMAPAVKLSKKVKSSFMYFYAIYFLISNFRLFLPFYKNIKTIQKNYPRKI